MAAEITTRSEPPRFRVGQKCMCSARDSTESGPSSWPSRGCCVVEIPSPRFLRCDGNARPRFCAEQCEILETRHVAAVPEYYVHYANRERTAPPAPCQDARSAAFPGLSLTVGCTMAVNRRLDEWVSEDRLRELVIELKEEEEFDPETVRTKPDHCGTMSRAV